MKSDKVVLFSLAIPLILFGTSIILDYHGSNIHVFNNFLNKPTQLQSSGGGTAFFYSWRDYLSFQFKWYALLTLFIGGFYCVILDDKEKQKQNEQN